MGATGGEGTALPFGSTYIHPRCLVRFLLHNSVWCFVDHILVF